MEPFWRDLGEGFGSLMGDFGWILGLRKASNFEAEVGSQKSGFKVKRGEVVQALGGPNIER